MYGSTRKVIPKWTEEDVERLMEIYWEMKAKSDKNNWACLSEKLGRGFTRLNCVNKVKRVLKAKEKEKIAKDAAHSLTQSDVAHQPSTVTSELSTVNSEPSTVTSELSTVNSEPSTVTSELSTVNSEPSTVKSEPSTVMSELSTVMSEPSTLNTELSIATSELSTVSSEPSTVTDQLLSDTKQTCKF